MYLISSIATIINDCPNTLLSTDAYVSARLLYLLNTNRDMIPLTPPSVFIWIRSGGGGGFHIVPCSAMLSAHQMLKSREGLVRSDASLVWWLNVASIVPSCVQVNYKKGDVDVHLMWGWR